jgi:hypothetical protein
MPLVSNIEDVTECWDPAFDRVFLAGAPVPHAGIYRCAACGHEIAVAAGDAIPQLPHAGHPPLKGPASWMLVAAAQGNAAD